MKMRIAIVALVKLEKNKLLHYNPQSLGLAKALAVRGCAVDVYSFEELEGDATAVTEIAADVRLIQQDCPSLGGNSLMVTRYLEKDYQALICLSDIQIAYSGLDRWCQKHQIDLFPYVGVIHSSSENAISKQVMDLVARRNLKKYRGRVVFAKTLPVKKELEAASIQSVLAPVGVDLSYLEASPGLSPAECREAVGFATDDSVLLFVGRLVDEKRPLALIDLFRKLSAESERYKLCIIGDGHLKEAMLEKVADYGLGDRVRHYSVVKNAEMWRFYQMADFSINLNLGEIFGMSILEAMFYQTLVVARRAPGPEMIINDKEDGYLCETDEAIYETILSRAQDVSVEAARRKIMEEFNWDRTSETMLEVIQSEAS
ncbi:MAG: glycosyltransferase family 4 protein [Verrucomicrobiota bacterium]